MCLKLISASLLVLCLSCIPKTTSQLECGDRKIDGGFRNGPEAQDGRWPWHALIYRKSASGVFQYACGGSIIDNNHILTAAHCIYTPPGGSTAEISNIIVYLGRTKLTINSDRSQVHKVAQLIQHPGYEPENAKDNIALIKLDANISMTQFVQPVCLWNANTGVEAVGADGFIAGVGDMERSLTEQLQDGPVHLVDWLTCINSDPEFYEPLLTTNMICGKVGVKYCLGYGGGGMVFSHEGTWFIRGISSFSHAKADKSCDLSKYTVFTDISKYRNWIQQYVASTTPSNKLIANSKPKPPFDVTKRRECGERKIKTQFLFYNAPEAKEGHWPWHAAIYQKRKEKFDYFCGGSIIDSRTILTAAHCLFVQNGLISKDRIAVHLGRIQLNTNSVHTQIHYVASLIPHPNFRPGNVPDDIGLVKLSSTIMWTDYIQPICLWSVDDGEKWITKHKGAVAGFGETELKQVANHLRQTIIDIVNHWTCLESDREVYGRHLTRSMLCGKGSRNVTACRGDSGGGLVYEIEGTWFVRGIVSYLPSNTFLSCDDTKYTVFTDIAKYLRWIENASVQQPTKTETRSTSHAIVFPVDDDY